MEIDQIAERILADGPDPVVEFRLRRDVLCTSPATGVESTWIRALEQAQRTDGGWGRFHTADARERTAIPTTEFAIGRALALGLDGDHPVVARATRYMTGLLSGRIEFPDRAERNDRWATGVELFVAATMARVVPGASELDDVWSRWATILERTFASGEYAPEAEALAHREITGASVANSYLVLSNRYAVALLGSRIGDLRAGTVRQYLEWLWRLPTGVGYLSVPLFGAPARNPAAIDHWFTSLELLGPFPTAPKSVEWLWSECVNNRWDFGPRWPRSSYLPLSESWRTPGRRQHDHSTRVLALLRACSGR